MESEVSPSTFRLTSAILRSLPLLDPLHTFEDVSDGTLIGDRVTYQLPLGPLGNLIHGITVRRQLENIFWYRAMRIDEWARGEMRRKGR